jgi:hypothetical protein
MSRVAIRLACLTLNQKLTRRACNLVQLSQQQWRAQSLGGRVRSRIAHAVQYTPGCRAREI